MDVEIPPSHILNSIHEHGDGLSDPSPCGKKDQDYRRANEYHRGDEDAPLRFLNILFYERGMLKEGNPANDIPFFVFEGKGIYKDRHFLIETERLLWTTLSNHSFDRLQ